MTVANPHLRQDALDLVNFGYRLHSLLESCLSQVNKFPDERGRAEMRRWMEQAKKNVLNSTTGLEKGVRALNPVQVEVHASDLGGSPRYIQDYDDFGWFSDKANLDQVMRAITKLCPRVSTSVDSFDPENLAASRRALAG